MYSKVILLNSLETNILEKGGITLNTPFVLHTIFVDRKTI